MAFALASLTRVHSAGGTVDRATLVTDAVRRGTLVRSVSAQGAFRPDVVRVVAASQSGVISRIGVKPGSVVQPSSFIAQMENPSLEAAVAAAHSQVDVARSNLASVEQQAQAAQLTQQSLHADAQAQVEQSDVQVKALAALHQSGLVPDVQYQQAVIQAKKSANDLRISAAQVGVGAADARAKIAVARAQLVQAQAQLAADMAQVAALTVVAKAAGIVQTVDVDPGTSVSQNTAIARIADVRSLKVVLQVAETDVHSVFEGMTARIDTGYVVIFGRVARIAPAAQNGAVAVDVMFRRALPASARPDVNVEGILEIERLRDALSIARPAGAADATAVELFKEVDGGSRAVRVHVRLGRGSADRVQVVSGLLRGDVVVVSDMSAYMDQPEIHLR